jgi:hypothetical protein
VIGSYEARESHVLVVDSPFDAPLIRLRSETLRQNLRHRARSQLEHSRMATLEYSSMVGLVNQTIRLAPSLPSEFASSQAPRHSPTSELDPDYSHPSTRSFIVPIKASKHLIEVHMA